MRWTKTQPGTLAWWLCLVLAAGCSGQGGGSTDGGGGGTTISQGGGSTDGGGTTTSQGGGGAGGAPFQARACGDGAECESGAKCQYTKIEAGQTCECDPSGHFLCDWWAGGGSGGGFPPPPCTQEDACALGGEGGCLNSNGFCTKTCDCAQGCSFDCSGEGPATGPEIVCDLAYCDAPEGEYGGCSVQDGACDYKVDCDFDGPPTLNGGCPP